MKIIKSLKFTHFAITSAREDMTSFNHGEKLNGCSQVVYIQFIDQISHKSLI